VFASVRVFLHRRLGDAIEVVTGFDEAGRPVVERHEVDVAPDFRGLLIPAEAVAALAEVVKPGPGEAEVARLEEALAVERGRVDAMLQAMHR
jgi:hypothetical protein